MCTSVFLAQLLAGGDSSLLQSLELVKNPTRYHYLSMGGESCECTRNDKKLYDEIQRAMGVGMRERERR